ncbi:MAG TPA: ABC transporter permease [Clostridiales bacterium]|nr:ABC transporter permease [Clostridiales bacterium]
MVIGSKDTVKLFGIAVIACCAAFVCTLFLSYNIDLAAIREEITTDAGQAMYRAQVLMGRVIAAVSGGCLIATSVVMLLFYVKSYVGTHGKELGILKALGYSDFEIARYFWVFGLPVLVGSAVGNTVGYLYLPTFYQKQAPSAQALIPALEVHFHPLLTFALVGAPTLAFITLSVLFAERKLKSPVLDLLRERQSGRVRIGRDGKGNQPFLKDLRRVTLGSRRSLVFFVAFSAFCFSAMVQMSFSMTELASETFAVMTLSIGLILAFVTLLLSLSSVVRGNTKTIAMMRVFGYDDRTCSRYILGAYRPISYIGFAVGTGYQYGLLRLMVSVVFAEVGDVPEYHFDLKAFVITPVLFVTVYELVMQLYSRRIRRLSVKSIMLE